jgi:hypothetical protein
LGLKPKSKKNIEKTEEMLSELKISQASSLKTITPISQQFCDSDSISSHDSTNSDIRVLEIFFGKIDLEPKLQRIFDNSKPFNIAKNWYSRPTPPDLNLKKDFFNHSFLFHLIKFMNGILMVCLNKNC